LLLLLRLAFPLSLSFTRSLDAETLKIEAGELRSIAVKGALIADISKAERILGYRPHVSFEEGLRKTVEYYRGKMATGRIGQSHSGDTIVEF
jgi:nucleoside-diphosphate-sugar epimerase